MSPIGSPVIHLRRRKTLRMLLNLSSVSERRLLDRDSVSDRSTGKIAATDGEKKKKSREKEGKGRRKLKDLLLLSSPPVERERCKTGFDNSGGLLQGSASHGWAVRRGGGGGGSLRQITGTFRCRTLRRAWRPVLVTISEN